MKKFHINKHGMPAPCKAKPGNCPLGGDENHYNTKEEAQAVVDKANEQKYGLVSGLNAVQHSKGYLKLNDLMEKGEFFKLEREAVLLNAKDVEGVYNAIQDLRGENGSIEKYYKLRKESDKKVYYKIGEHKIALSSIPHGSQNLTSVSSKEIKADLSVDKDGNINNLYLERNNDGEPVKVLKINNIDKQGPNLLLENGEELTHVSITNWNMRRYYSTSNNEPDFNPSFTGPNSWKMYATKPDGETYEGYKKVDVFNRDSSD